ncbi:MAG: hypothetical protein ABSF28_26060 [Terracidiphilus sp.]|jgi:hypothetical protein
MKASMLQNGISVISSQALRATAVVVLSFAATSLTARAQTTVGGHVGFVLPLVTWSGGQTTDLADNFSIGFPAGITVKGTGRMAFDMEFVSSVQDSPRDVSVTVHPGFLWNVGHGFAPGIRAAFVVNSSEYGFTPLLNKSWPIKSKGSFFKAYFAEADLPVRFNRPVGGPDTNPVTFAMHFGLGF